MMTWQVTDIWSSRLSPLYTTFLNWGKRYGQRYARPRGRYQRMRNQIQRTLATMSFNMFYDEVSPLEPMGTPPLPALPPPS